MSGGGRSASLSRTSIVLRKTAPTGSSSAFVAIACEVWTFANVLSALARTAVKESSQPQSL